LVGVAPRGARPGLDLDPDAAAEPPRPGRNLDPDAAGEPS
jgi:hypothetical protein